MFTDTQSLPESSGRAKLLLCAIVVVACIGLGLAAYLTWTTWNASSVAGCGGDGLVDCDHVLASNWSKWLGQPVSLFGTLTYVGILSVCGFLAMSSRGIAKTILLTLSLLAAGSATWFIGIQALILQSFCLYCMGVHVCSLVICTLTVFYLKSSPQVFNEDQSHALFGAASVPGVSGQEESFSTSSETRPLLAVGVAALGLLLLMGGQFFYQPPGMVIEKVEKVDEAASPEGEGVENIPAQDTAAFAEPENPPLGNTLDPEIETTNSDPEQASSTESRERFIQFASMNKPINVAELPILGSPQAKYVLVEMIDYTCMHCRHLHPYVHAALERYGDQLAFVVLHVPLSKNCNPHVIRQRREHKYACEYARMALNIWKLDQEKFEDYHNWLMDSEKPPSAPAAKARALRLVGKQVLIDETLAADSLRNVAGNIDDLMAMQSGLPILLSEEQRVRGIPRNEKEWFDSLEILFPIKPLEDAAK